MPRDPPVTRAVLPAMEKRSFIRGISPRVDVRPLLDGPRTCRRRRRAERGRDPAAAVGGVDHVVDLEVGGRVEGLAVLVCLGDHPLEGPVALGRYFTSRELGAIAEADGALESHSAE